MLYFTHKLLNEDQINKLSQTLLSTSDWVDGKISNRASKVKRNLQLDWQSEQYRESSEEIRNTVFEDQIIKNAVFPAKIHNILFTQM